MIRVFFFFLVGMLTIASGPCSSCVNDVVETAKAPTTNAAAVLKTRQCGSVEGWVVTVTPVGMPEREVFQAVVPHPVSVVETPHAIGIRWQSSTTLIISGPNWIRTHREDRGYDDIQIRYELNSVPYPADRASSQ
jgi:hypothetical protein